MARMKAGFIKQGREAVLKAHIAAHIAQAMPSAHLVTIKDCGHFAFLERPGEVRRAIDGFLLDAPADKQHR